MRFAEGSNGRLEAAPGLSGTCPGCGSPLVAKCGKSRVWHWSHRGNRSCDPWWEPETEWHRNWKAQFPIAQQEVRQQASDGEWHVADVKTEMGLVFEFQHSHLAPEERVARDGFYADLVWIVDGTRLQRIAKQFFKGFHSNAPGSLVWEDDAFYSIKTEHSGFPEEWKDCRHPVCFDFNRIDLEGKKTRFVWCLFPEEVRGYRIVGKIEASEIIRLAQIGADPVSRSYYVGIMRNSIEKALR